MAKQQLDRNRYFAQVYGDENKKFYQDGIYFDGGGEAISSGKTAKKQETEASPVTEETKTQDDEAVTKLNDMTYAQLKVVAEKVSEATGTEPERWSGKGVADLLRKYILDNTD